FLGSLFETLEYTLVPERDDTKLNALAWHILDKRPKTLLGLAIRARAEKHLCRHLWTVDFERLPPPDQARTTANLNPRLSGAICSPLWQQTEIGGLWRAARQAHRKHRTFAQLARHGHVASHHARELAGDGKAEPRAAEALRGCGVSLA